MRSIWKVGVARFVWRGSIFIRTRNISGTNWWVHKPFFGNKIKISGKIIETSKDSVGRDVLDHMVHPLVVAATNCPLETEDISYFIKYSQKAQKEQYGLDKEG